MTGGLIGILVPSFSSAYHATPVAVLVAGLLGALVASALWAGLTSDRL